MWNFLVLAGYMAVVFGLAHEIKYEENMKRWEIAVILLLAAIVSVAALFLFD